MAGNDPYKVPLQAAQDEFIERRSRFIGHIWPVADEAQALAYLKQTREQYWDASHNVYAYIIKENNIMRYSDDGEPQGTAGMPVLEVLRREGVTNVLCVATRYFGGILLGAGGLVRAYAHTAKIALDAAGIAVMCRYETYLLACPYNLFDPLMTLLPEYECIVDDTEYAADVTLTVSLPQERAQAFCARVVDFTSGRVEPVYMEDKFFGRRI